MISGVLPKYSPETTYETYITYNEIAPKTSHLRKGHLQKCHPQAFTYETLIQCYEMQSVIAQHRCCSYCI